MSEVTEVQSVLTRTHCPVCGQGRFALESHQQDPRSDGQYQGLCQGCGDQFGITTSALQPTVGPPCPCCNAGAMVLTMICASPLRQDREVYCCHGCGHAAARSVLRTAQSSAG